MLASRKAGKVKCPITPEVGGEISELSMSDVPPAEFLAWAILAVVILVALLVWFRR